MKACLLLCLSLWMVACKAPSPVAVPEKLPAPTLQWEQLQGTTLREELGALVHDYWELKGAYLARETQLEALRTSLSTTKARK